MHTTQLMSETRTVSDFTSVSLKMLNTENHLVIRQGATESLLIEAKPDMLERIETHVHDGELLIQLAGNWSAKLKDALTTSLSRGHIHCELTVKKLANLDITGITRVDAPHLETDYLRLRLHGMGHIRCDSLQANLLEVDLNGMGQVDLAGEVAEQRISLNAMGTYRAPRLESKKAVVQLRGSGTVTLWAANHLDVTIWGPGRVEYYGNPRVNQNVAPLGRVVSLSKP